MKRVLITGMSGTGKSAVIQELASRGYPAHDLDTPEWSEWIEAAPTDGLTPVQGKDWVWREDRVRELLSGSGDGTLLLRSIFHVPSKSFCAAAITGTNNPITTSRITFFIVSFLYS